MWEGVGRVEGRRPSDRCTVRSSQVQLCPVRSSWVRFGQRSSPQTARGVVEDLRVRVAGPVGSGRVRKNDLLHQSRQGGLQQVRSQVLHGRHVPQQAWRTGYKRGTSQLERFLRTLIQSWNSELGLRDGSQC